MFKRRHIEITKGNKVMSKKELYSIGTFTGCAKKHSPETTHWERMVKGIVGGVETVLEYIFQQIEMKRIELLCMGGADWKSYPETG
jgi:hypothetical protein